MGRKKVTAKDNSTSVNRREINRVPLVTVVYTAPHMAQDARIQVNAAIENNPLLQQGKRYGDWSQVKESK